MEITYFFRYVQQVWHEWCARQVRHEWYARQVWHEKYGQSAFGELGGRLGTCAEKWICRVKQLLFPRRCPVCDQIVIPFGEKICTDCLPKLHVVAAPWCEKCGKELLVQERICDDCKKRQHLYVRGRMLFRYRDVSKTIFRYKYGNRPEYADFFGESAALYLGDFLRSTKADALIPVPLHPRREQKRGYNQALLLAEAISKYSGIPVEKDLVKRVKNTRPMKLLTPRERQNNLKKAFIVSRNDVKLNITIIIDDIYTTGATMDEISAVLMQSGVEKVFFLTLAGGAGV